MENRFPKNVRQIGNVSDTPKIYVEDYVDTFLNQLCTNMEEELTGAFLIGHTVRQDEQDCIYISGAICMQEPTINSAVWDEAEQKREEFFPDDQFIGWCLIKKDGLLPYDTDMKYLHAEYFDEFGTVLILKSEEEEQYFAYKYKDLMPMNGHYIYYEKNVAMQNYMIMHRKQIGMSPSEDVEDKAAKEFRNIVKERIIIKEEKKQFRWIYVACLALVIVVLGMGVTNVNNYEKIRALQGVLDHVRESNVERAAPVLEEKKVEMIPAKEELQKNEEEEAVPAVQEIAPEIYIVEKGDTLVKISRKVYGDSRHVEAICKMNGLNDGNLIFIGQKLLLP